MNQNSVLMLFKSAEYDALLACASSKKESAQMERHVKRLKDATKKLLDLSEKLESIGSEDGKAGLRLNLDVLVKVIELQQLMTDRAYMKFLLKHCEPQYVRNEQNKVKLSMKTAEKMLVVVEKLAKKGGFMDKPYGPLSTMSSMSPMLKILEGDEYAKLINCVKDGGDSFIKKHVAKVEKIGAQVIELTKKPSTFGSFLKLGKMVIDLQNKLTNSKYITFVLRNCSEQFIDNEIAKVKIVQEAFKQLTETLKKHRPA
jgi:hypothetical protein